MRFLERLRWADGFVSAHCGVLEGGYWQSRDCWRRCAACRKETSVSSDTIFEGTRYPLLTEFHACWYVVSQKRIEQASTSSAV